MQPAASDNGSIERVCDIDKSTVEHVADDRKAESLGVYLGGLSRKQRWGDQSDRDGHVGALLQSRL